MFYISTLTSTTKVNLREPPDGVQYSDYNITKSGRTADGTMTMDYIAKKHKFEFSYDVISATDLDPVLAIIDDSSNMFFNVYYYEGSTLKSCIMYVGEIQKVPFRKGPVWYWKTVKFDFIEK
jgi:hypothetical protein